MPVAHNRGIISVFLIAAFLALTALGLISVANPVRITAAKLLTGGGFESGTTSNWIASHSTTIFTLTSTSTFVYSGTWAAAVGSSNTNNTNTRWIYQKIPDIAGDSHYTLSGYAYKDTPDVTLARLRIAWYAANDCTGSQHSIVDSTTVLTDDVASYRFLTTGSVESPDTAQCAQIRLQVQPANSNSGVVYFDNLTFTFDDSPTPTPTLTITPTATVTPTPVPTSTAAPGDVVINEVVSDPQQDWSSNDFNGIPGVDSVTQGTDEFIELHIKADNLNLTGWTIELLDGTDVIGDLTDSGAFQVSNYVGAGHFTNTLTGDYLVLGNVASSGAMNNDILIILKDNLGVIIDKVEIGSDPEGDGPDDGAPDGIGNGNASGTEDEAIARSPNGADTDDDIYDFAAQNVTMGAANIPPPSITEGVIINEIAWGGTDASSSDEWIELYNVTTQTIRLNGWSLSSAKGDVHIALSGDIPAAGYFLLERSDDDAITDIPADQIYTGALNNDGDGLILKSGNVIVDAVNNDGGGWPAGGASPNYDSMERVDSLLPGGDGNWASNDRIHRNGLDADGNPVNGTPGQANSTTYPPPPPPVYLPMILNEILPDPGGTDWDGSGEADSEDEWIELFNPNQTSVDLSGWTLRDAAEKTYTFPEGALISPGQYLAIYRDVTGIALNNSGDTVSLYRPDGALADEIVYDDNPGDDISVCRHPDTGELHTYCLPTPNAANIILPPPGPLELSIYDAKHVTEGAWVTVRGYVTAPPGVYGKNVFYIQDSTHGIRVKLPSNHGLYFDFGSRLEVTGYLDLYYNEWEIDLKSKSDVRRLDGFKLIPPLPIGGGLLREGYEGLLVQLSVTPMAFKKGSTHFWVEDPTGLAYVYIYRGAGIKRKNITLGLPTTIVGIAGQRTKSQPPLDGYRLFPRALFDIVQYPIPVPVPDNWPTLLPETGGGPVLGK